MNGKRKKIIMSEKEFNELNADSNQSPECDSPGGENEIELEETLMGMEYEEDEILDDPTPLP